MTAWDLFDLLDGVEPDASVLLCADCGHCTSEMNEYYMVTKKVWAASLVAPASTRPPWPATWRDVLCIGCLEHRLGRTLCARDFPADLPVNLEWEQSDRLKLRLHAPRARRLKPEAP